MTRMNRLRLVAAALAASSLGACDGKLQVVEQQRWSENAADCPGEMPDQTSACNAAEGRVCRYSYIDSAQQNMNTLCGCWEASEGVLRWDCYGTHGGQYSCPDSQPASGASCDGQRSAHCRYPTRAECTCPTSGAATWHCENAGRSLPAAPAIDAQTPVSQLSDAQRELWCEWLLLAYQGPGFPEPPMSPLTSDGMTTNIGCMLPYASRFACNASVPELPVAYCKGNLSLSTCEAPVSELSDCIRTVLDECWPAPHGCARYLEKPGCDGTIVRGGGNGTGGGPATVCSIKVQ